ncbi:hypothetical protein DINM_005277 [Dirofilaria immitis]|nr:hypothetical protein [Dirofilaria immitis]
MIKWLIPMEFHFPEDNGNPILKTRDLYKGTSLWTLSVELPLWEARVLFLDMKHLSRETLKEEEENSQEISKAPITLASSSTNSLDQNLNCLYKAVFNSTKMNAKRRRQKMRLKLREKLGEEAVPKEKP